MTRSARPRREVWVEDIMGTPVSVHLRLLGPQVTPHAHDAVRACFDELQEVDRIFSPYRPESDISRLRRGDLTLEEADPRVALVVNACRTAEQDTDGLFSSTWRGWFDPTGYVKGWAVEAAARRHLAPLIESALGVGINAGGDMQLFTAPGADWRWNVGIADPHRPGTALATVEVENGAVATSGTAERGRHIIDPRTGSPASGVLSATVVADGLTTADLWATVAVVAGMSDRTWLPRAGTRSGLIVADDGRVSRWLGSTPIDVVAA